MTAPSTNRPAPDAGREGFLDVVRAVAVVRVVIWHAFGAAGITYVVAAVPAMFFVFASLLAKSLDRRGVRAVLLDRARRVLLPLWAFAAAAHVVMLAAAHARPGPNTRIPWSGAVLWLLPINDPKGSAWEAGWLAAPLWYLRALAWLLLAAPVLLRLVRRAPRATVALLAVAVFALDLAGRDAAWTAPHAPMLLWRLGDFALYGLFVCLGFLHRDGVLGRLSASRWLGAGAMAAGAAGLWGLTQPVPDGVVNNSHPMHLFVGFAWLALAFAAQRPLARLADARLTGPLVHAVTQRSLTIYLWHSGVIILAYQLLWRSHLDLPPGVFSAALLALVAAGVAAIVAAVGWIEDAAGARPARLWPRRAASKVRSPSDRRGGARGWGLALWSGELCAVAMTAFAVLAAGGGAATPALRTQTPPTPSRQPPPPVFAADGELALPRAADERDATIPDGATSDWIDDGGAFPWGPPIDEFGWLGPGLPAPPSPPDPPAAPDAANAATPAAGAAAPSTTRTPRTTAAPNPTPSAVRTRATLGSGAAGTPQAGPALAAELAGVLEAWLAETGVSGGQAGVLRYGEIQWSSAAGVGGAGETLSVGQSFDVASITKTYTAALVFRYAEAGLIDLDAPLPPLAALPGFPYAGVVTPRQLLTHSTGLVNYRATPSYLSHGSSVVTPALALGWAGAEPLQFEPGTAQDYSSSNYLALGLLLEQVTGLEFTQLVRRDILRPARLTNTSFMPPNDNSPNSSTAGVMTTVDDLLRWGVLALRDHVLISDAAFAQMTTIEESTAMGGGVMGYCPCTRKRGRPVWRAIGHGGANTELQYSTADDLVVAVNLNAGIWDRLDEVHELVERLRRTVAAYG